MGAQQGAGAPGLRGGRLPRPRAPPPPLQAPCWGKQGSPSTPAAAVGTGAAGRAGGAAHVLCAVGAARAPQIGVRAGTAEMVVDPPRWRAPTCRSALVCPSLICRTIGERLWRHLAAPPAKDEGPRPHRPGWLRQQAFG